MSDPRIIVGVPGPWPTRTALLQAIARTGRLLFAGFILRDIHSGAMFELDVYEHDPNLRRSFEPAGAGRISAQILDEIEEHRQTAYVIGPAGSVERVRAIVAAASGILDAGGIAVKIESAGIAHDRDQWTALADADEFSLYRAFVLQVVQDSWFYTCGMHAFGLPEVRVPRSVGARNANTVSTALNMYEITEHPDLRDGHTFQADPAAPRWKLRHGACDVHDADSPFYNPHGMWTLTPSPGAT